MQIVFKLIGLTHWGQVTHICVSKLTIIGSDNGLSPDRRQAIMWTNAWLLFIWPLGTNFSEILIEILTFSFKKMRLKVSSAKLWPFCLGLNELIVFQIMVGNHQWIFYWTTRFPRLGRYDQNQTVLKTSITSANNKFRRKLRDYVSRVGKRWWANTWTDVHHSYVFKILRKLASNGTGNEFLVSKWESLMQRWLSSVTYVCFALAYLTISVFKHVHPFSARYLQMVTI